MHNGLSADTLGAAVADNHRLKQLSVEDNPMAASPLAEVSALVGASPSLEVLTLVGCGLSQQAGGNLAEAVRFSTALRLPLNTLDLQGNRLDSEFAYDLIAALSGNCRLVELKLANQHVQSPILEGAELGTVAVLQAGSRLSVALRTQEERSCH